MSQEFTLQEFCHFNWNDSFSLKSEKNVNFTMSEISKNDLQFNIFPQQHINDQWNVQEFNKKSAKKLKNKINVKNYRERQKNQQIKNQKKIKMLEHQNQILKSQKYCRHCKKPYGGYIQISNLQHQHTQPAQQKQIQYQTIRTEKSQPFEYQKINYFPNKENKNTKNNGKIWIALGILMMVIGLHLYGFKGKDGYKDISISKIQSQKIISLYQNKFNNKLEDYFDVKLKVKSKSPKQFQSHRQIFKTIRIFHEQQNQQKRKQFEEYAQKTLQKLQMIEEEREIKNRSEIDIEGQSTEEQVKFHKELLFAIQAEIDDVGNYL